MNRLTSRSLSARTAALLASLAMVFTTLLVTSPSASAYRHIGVSGRPGAVQPYQTLGTHLQVPCGGLGFTNCFAPGLIGNGPVVFRSPASRRLQYVTVRYNVFRWDGSVWLNETRGDFSRAIRAGRKRVAFGPWNVLLNTGGHKKTSFNIVWSNARGRVLATSVVAMNGNDYACSTRFTFKCTAHTGSVAVYTP